MGLSGNLTNVLQQAEVLHVASTDLKTINIGMDHLAMSGVHYLGEGFQAVLLSAGLHDLQTFFAQALERMGVRAGLECAAADPGKTQAGNAFGNFIELLFRFDRARTSVDGDLVGAGAVVGE